ncbi:Cysteine protease ATG4 [Hypsizygus marmoreus]|uniref:Autophagy-related protein 4 n=1 Tax=Hypsizygus marmoreus TaxID=39966 RepID=A0A369K921_HYPMA|nr:Cysteine protease ATG4 [Hypsizygus marmoreus]
MSPKNSHQSSPTSPPLAHASKLPKFLQNKANRDRSKSVTDPSGSPSTSSLASSSTSVSSDGPSSTSKSRKSKFLPIREKEDKARRSSEVLPPDEPTVDEPPVIIEPVNIPRPRTRSERPLSTGSDQHLSLYSSTSSTSRIGDLPTRLSGWFSHTFSTSSTDLSLPSLLSQTSTSPKSKSSALLMAAKHGKGHLDKAVRYLLDSDSTPDKCTDPIWLLGVQHPGYEAPQPISLSASTSSHRTSGSFRSSTSSASSLSYSELQPVIPAATPSKHVNPAANWPPVFYADFTSRVWLTYRSHFTPIRDGRLADLSSGDGSGGGGEVSSSPTTVRSRPWGWVGGEKGWTSDSGWGCMLRTGQSLLASALVHLHLGRDWRRPPYAVHTVDYATYVQILTWFFDTPSPEAPFSVHRMALAGKELGKDVGQWFGPSTAAGAIKTLVNSFPEAGLGVSVATDGVLFQSDVFAASHTGSGNSRSPRRHAKAMSSAWGDRPVLLLVGVRLGIDGVNPIYYDTIKLLYTFPQSVGIAGGRPSSSYYFVGSQADNLFYLDPHHARPAIPLRPPPPSYSYSYRETTPESDRDTNTKQRNQRSPTPNHQRAPTSPSSIRTGSSTFSYHAPLSPSPLQQEFSTSSEQTGSSSSSNHNHSHSQPLPHAYHDNNNNARTSRSPPPSSQHHHHSRFRSASHSHSQSPSRHNHSHRHHHQYQPDPSDVMDAGELSGLDPVQEHYVTAYHTAELKTFHCERVRKMPLSGLDPSMLIGFLCQDEADWRDFRRRVGDLPRMVFSVQDEPPTWPSDSDDNMGLESISEPDDLDLDMDMDEEDDEARGNGDEDEEDEEAEQFFDTRSVSASVSSASASGSGASKGRRSKSEDVDTEEDPVDPITPGPNSRFSIGQPPPSHEDEGKKGEELADAEEGRFEEGDIEDDWVDPSIPSSLPPGPTSSAPASSQPPPPSNTSFGSADGDDDVPAVQPKATRGTTKKSKKSGRKGGQIPVPVPLVKIPTPNRYQQPQEHFPFPRSAEETSPTPGERARNSSAGKGNGKRMHTARARDGGRTQSGGVKGVLTED